MLTDRHHVTGHELIRLDSNPLVVTLALNGVRRNGHSPELCQSAKTLHITSTTESTTKTTTTHLPDHGTFKDNKHKQRE